MKLIIKFVTLYFPVLCLYVFFLKPAIVFADEKSESIEGRVYEFDEKSNYEFSSTSAFRSTSDAMTYGDFNISGGFVSEGTDGDVISFGVDGGKVDFTYSYKDTLLRTADDQWHIVEDDGKKVDGLKLDSKIKKGALIIQSSNDGNRWVVDTIITNAFSDEPKREEPFYTTKDVQLTNGTFFRFIVVYKTGMKTGEKKIGPITRDQYVYKKTAEVYEFYLYDVNSEDRKGDSTSTKVLGTEVVNTGKDNGYSGSSALNIKDPHYGWKIGQFFVSGYTRDTTDPKTNRIVFLKNVGDEVTLWFNLEQDIDRLNGDDKLSISDDANGYDQYFQTEKTDMGRGTLIVQFTDYQGIKHEPVIYKNFLAANAKTSADTIVNFFEEGDYEVALDYEIKSIPRQVAGVDIVPEYTNYRTSFSFAVRNGNCMVYPFDAVTGDELSIDTITPNGFKLDLAKSRYLTIDIQRASVTEGPNGYVEDVRFNRPAKDGDQYVDEGIYTFNVKNLYTGENTTKKIYVGDTNYMKALSVNKISVDELNNQLSQGAKIEDNGTLTMSDR